MDRHELMVGDWIETLNQNKEVCRVQVNEIQEKQVSFYHKNHYYLGASYENIKPVALTKEMLLLNGFEDHGCYFSLQCDMIRVVYKDELFWINVDTWSIDIRHVHRLQHIMCICGLYDLANKFKIE